MSGIFRLEQRHSVLKKDGGVQYNFLVPNDTALEFSEKVVTAILHPLNGGTHVARSLSSELLVETVYEHNKDRIEKHEDGQVLRGDYRGSVNPKISEESLVRINQVFAGKRVREALAA